MNTSSPAADGAAPVTADSIMETFKAAGFRATRPRQLIARQLARHAAAQTDFGADELWHQLHHLEPQLGRATLFRAVDALVGLGILDRIEYGDGTRRYRVCHPGHHHHLICIGCHRIEEVDVCVPETALLAVAADAGFVVERHALEVYGRCADCRLAEA